LGGFAGLLGRFAGLLGRFAGLLGGLPNVIFEDCLIGKFSEFVVEFNFEGGGPNLANPTNFSCNLPDSPDSKRDCKL
jgi:hypothetical protein